METFPATGMTIRKIEVTASTSLMLALHVLLESKDLEKPPAFLWRLMRKELLVAGLKEVRGEIQDAGSSPRGGSDLKRKDA